jgi:peptidoglycan hydrolase CwlO-like protein
MKKIFLITILLTLSSCVVSTKVFDATVSDLQNQIDSKLPRYEFELKDQIIRKTIDNLQKDCCKTKNDTIINGKCKM